MYHLKQGYIQGHYIELHLNYQLTGHFFKIEHNIFRDIKPENYDSPNWKVKIIKAAISIAFNLRPSC